jgi:hypothetical protein
MWTAELGPAVLGEGDAYQRSPAGIGGSRVELRGVFGIGHVPTKAPDMSRLLLDFQRKSKDL